MFISPTLFNIFLERIITDALEDHEGTVIIEGRAITNPRFADDVDGLAGEKEELAKLVERLDKASTANGMEVSAEKTKLMTNNTSGINTEIKVNGQKLETATRSRAPRKNTSHGNEVLPQDPTHLIQRPCYQRGSLCQDPAGNWTTRRPDDRKRTQTAVVWSCFPFIMSGQNHLARHSERGKKTRQTKEEVGRQHQGMDRPGVRQVPEGLS